MPQLVTLEILTENWPESIVGLPQADPFASNRFVVGNLKLGEPHAHILENKDLFQAVSALMRSLRLAATFKGRVICSIEDSNPAFEVEVVGGLAHIHLGSPQAYPLDQLLRSLGEAFVELVALVQTPRLLSRPDLLLVDRDDVLFAVQVLKARGVSRFA